jgi:hypothetical protein
MTDVRELIARAKKAWTDARPINPDNESCLCEGCQHLRIIRDLAALTVDVPTASAPAPRRWWVVLSLDNRPYDVLRASPEPHEWRNIWQSVVPVVEASALEAVERERDAVTKDRDDLLYVKRITQNANKGLADRVIALTLDLTAMQKERDAARVDLARARRVTREQVIRMLDVYFDCRSLKTREAFARALRAIGLEVEG